MSKKVAGLFPLKKSIASLVTIAFLGTTVCQPFAEASFWGDRRKAQEKFARNRQGSEQAPLLLASANLGSAFGSAQPIPVAPAPADLSRLSGPLQQSPLFRSLPYANVSVRDVYLPSTSPRQLVIHIQDVHANWEAQKNIAASLVSLAASSSDSKDKPRLLVGLEGAQGPFFIDALRTFPDKEILNEGADLFLKKDLLAGAEFAALTSPRGMDLWGVEDRALYQRHVKSVVDATPLESSFRKTLADLRNRNRVLKAKEYTEALKAWDKEYESYHAERSSLGAYVRHMAHGMSRGAFPQVAKFLDALDTEEKLDFPRAERERKTLVESLAERLSPQDLATLTQRAVAFRAGQMGFGAFHSELISLSGKAGVALSGAQEFLKYMEYVKRVEGIDRTALLDEIDGQENAYVARLLKSASPRAGEVYGVSRDLVMADKLLRHAMTPNEWEEYIRHASDVKNIPTRLSSLESTSPADATDFASSILIFEEFYKAGVARNQVLVDNLFARMGPGSADGKYPSVAVLVAGGFHTDGVTALIKKRGAAYVTLTPRFEVVNGQDSLDVFRQQKTPLDRLFSGEKLNLVEGLGVAVTPLSGGSGRGEQVLAEIPTALAAASNIDAQGLVPWLDQLKTEVSGVKFEFVNWGDKSGYVVTFEDNGRQLFAWSSETPADEGSLSFKLGNGIINFMPYNPPLSRKVTSFVAKYKKQVTFASVSALFTSIVHAMPVGLLAVPVLAVSTGPWFLLTLGLTGVYLFRNQFGVSFADLKNFARGPPSGETVASAIPRVSHVLVPLLAAGALWGAAVFFGIPMLGNTLVGWQSALNALAGNDVSTVVGAAGFFGAKLVGILGALVSLTPTVAMLTGIAILGRLALFFPAGQKALSFLVPKSLETSAQGDLERGKAEVKQGKIVTGVTHLIVDVIGTLYNFAFVQADRAFQLMVNGQVMGAASPLTYTERKFMAFRRALEARGLSPLMKATLSALALPLIALQGIVVRRLYLMVLSTISNIGLTVATGKVLMVVAPLFGFDPVLALGAIVGFSLLSHLDLFFGKGWTAAYSQQSEVFRSLVVVASPFAALNSFILAFLMTSVKVVRQNGIGPVLTTKWWSVVAVQSFHSAFGKSLSLSGVLGSIHLVGFEIAVVKWIAHLTGGPIETVLLAIEGPQNSVLGAGNQVAVAAGLGDIGSGVTAVTRDGHGYSVADVRALSVPGLPRISWAIQRLDQNPNDPVARDVLVGEPTDIIARLTRHLTALPDVARVPLERLAKNPENVQVRREVQSLLQGILDGTVDVGDSKEMVGLIAHGLPLMGDLQRQSDPTRSPEDSKRMRAELKGWADKGGESLLAMGPETPTTGWWGRFRAAWVNMGAAAAAERAPTGVARVPSTKATQSEISSETVWSSVVQSLKNSLPGVRVGDTPGTVEIPVQKGMTMGGIIRALAMSGALLPGMASPSDLTAAIRDANGLNPQLMIKAGQTLIVPLDPAGILRPAAPSENVRETADKGALSPAPAAADRAEPRREPTETVWNSVIHSIENLLPGARTGETLGTVVVTVQPGWTVGKIVSLLGRAGAFSPGMATPTELVKAIRDANGLNSKLMIKVGQALVIPLDPAGILGTMAAPSGSADNSPAVGTVGDAGFPDLLGRDSGPVQGTSIEHLSDVVSLVQKSLSAQRDAAKHEAVRLRAKAEHSLVQAAPGAGLGAYSGPAGSGVSMEIASRWNSDALPRYEEAQRWADFTDADIALMARDRTRQAVESLLSYRTLSETLNIKRDALRGLESVSQQGASGRGANFDQALKNARDEVHLLEKAEQEAAREARNLLGLRVKDSIRVRGGFLTETRGQSLDVYNARIQANVAKIRALSQELGTDGADQVARYFKEELNIQASAAWFKEAGSTPLPQLGLMLNWKGLEAERGKEFAERVAKAVELLTLKSTNDQLKVESAQIRDNAVQQLRAIRENGTVSREALAAADAFVGDQTVNYNKFGRNEIEANGLARALRAREEALAGVLALQSAEAQARARFLFAGGTGDPEQANPLSAPLARDEASKLDVGRLLDAAIHQRLGFSEKEIENVASEGGWEALAGKLNVNLRVTGSFYKGGSPVSVTFGVLLRDSNADAKAQRAHMAVSRAETLVKAARNQVVNEVTTAYLAFRDAQEAHRLAVEAESVFAKLVPTDLSHPAYFDRKSQAATGRAQLFQSKINELNAWRALQVALGVDPKEAAKTLHGFVGASFRDPTSAVEASKARYDPKADRALAAVLQERIDELGLQMATNTDQYWDPKLGFAVLPGGGAIPLLWTDRLANIPATLLSPLTWPFRALNGDTRFFYSPLDDRIDAETRLAEAQLKAAQANRVFQQGLKKGDSLGAAEALENAEGRVKRAEVQVGRVSRDLADTENLARQKKTSSSEVVRQRLSLVQAERVYQQALGDYRLALNRVHGLGLNPGTAALEAKSLPGLSKLAAVSAEVVKAVSEQSVDPIKAALGYLKATAPTTSSTAPTTIFGIPLPGAASVAGRVEAATGMAGDQKMAVALAKAQSQYAANSRAYDLLREFENIARWNEKIARVYWLNIVRPQVETVFPGDLPDLRKSRDLSNEAARFRDEIGKKTEAARQAVVHALGGPQAVAPPEGASSLSGRPPAVRWVGDLSGVSPEAHPAVRAAGAAGETAATLAKINALARHLPDVSFNIEEVQPASGGDPQVRPVLRVYMNATPSVKGAVNREAFSAEGRAARLDREEQIRLIENEMDDLARRISEGSNQLPGLYETVQSARKNVSDKIAAYQLTGVSESGQAVKTSGFGLVESAAKDYWAALKNYTNARADFELSLARFNSLMVLLGQNPGDFLQITEGGSSDPTALALPPPSKAKDDVKIPFPGMLPGSLSRPGFTFEQRFEPNRDPNDPLADRPTRYVEVDLERGRPTGREIEARYTLDSKDPARRTTTFIDHRPYAAGDPRKDIPPTLSVFSEVALRSNPYNPLVLPDVTVGWDRTDGWTVQSVAQGGAARVVVDVVTPDGKHIRDEVIRDGKGVRLKNQGGDVPLTKVSSVTDRSGRKFIQKATELRGRTIWEGQFTERQEPVSFVDHRNKTRGRVVGRESLPRGAAVTLPDGGRARLVYGGSLVVMDGVDSQGKPIKTFDVLADNFSSLGSVTNLSVLRRDPAHPDLPGQLAVAASYTQLGDRDASELRVGEAGVQREGKNVSLTLPAKDPYARLAYQGENVYVLPTNNGGIPGLAFVSPRGEGLSAEVREGVKTTGLIVENSGTLREAITYGAPLPNGVRPMDIRNPKGSPIPESTAYPPPTDDLLDLTKKEQGVKAPEVKEQVKSPPKPAEEKLPWWEELSNKIRQFFIGNAGAAVFEDIRATSKGLLDTDNQPVHLNGVNWRGIQYGGNFGDTANGFARHREWMEGELVAMKASGVNAVRIPLLDDGRHLNGDYSNFNQFKGDIQVFLDAAAKQGIRVEFVLFDYLAVARGKFDMSPKATENFRAKFLTPFLKEFGRHPALLTIDLINEPEWILNPSVPGGRGDKMEGGRRAVNKENYQRFIASFSGAIKDSQLKDKDGQPVAGRVLVTVGTSIKHHATVTDPGVRDRLDYYSWHHYDWMGSLKDYMKSVPLDNKPFELGEYATDGTQTTPADYMRDVRTNEGGVGAFAWNWGARVGQKIDEHTTANTNKLRTDLKAAGEISKDPKAAPTVTEDKSVETATNKTEAKKKPLTEPSASAAGTYRSYLAPDGTTYTPMPDGKTVIRSLGDPFDPANESDQRVISIPAGFDFGAPGAQAFLDNPANAARSLIRGNPLSNGLTAVAVHSGAKPIDSNLIRVFYQDKAKNTYTQQSDGTWTVTPFGARAPSVVVNPGGGFQVTAPDALARLTSLGNRVGFYLYEPASLIERKGKYDIPAPAGTYVQRYYALDSTGKKFDSGRPVEVHGYVFSDKGLNLSAESAIHLTQVLRPSMTATAAERVDWDMSSVLAEPMLYQRERLGLTYSPESVEMVLAQKIAVSAKMSYGDLLVERVQAAQEASFRERHGLGPKDSIPPPLRPLQRDEAERRVDEFLLINAVDLVPSVLARSIGMADKVNANDVRGALALIRKRDSLDTLDGLVARFTLAGAMESNRAVLDAMDHLIKTLSGTMDYQDASKVMQILYHLNTIPFVGADEVGKPAVRPAPLDGKKLIEIIHVAEKNAIQMRESFLKRYPQRDRATTLFSSEGFGVLLYWATNDVVTPVPLARKADREKTHPVGPPETMIDRSEAIERAKRPPFSYLLEALDTPLFKKFLERWKGPSPSYADFLESATLLTNQMAKNQSVFTPAIMRGILARLGNGDHSNVFEEVEELQGTKDELRESRAREAFFDANLILLWILVPLGLGTLFKRFYRKRGESIWKKHQDTSSEQPSQEPPLDFLAETQASYSPSAQEMAPLLTDLAKDFAAVGGDLAGDFRKGHQALEQGRVFMKSTAGPRVTISSWRLTNFLSMGAGVIIFLAQAYAVSTFGNWDGFTVYLWGLGTIFFLNGLLGNFLSWKMVGLSALILLSIYGAASGTFSNSDWLKILLGGTLSSKLKWRSPDPETDWSGARILANGIQSYFPRLVLWGWTEWKDEKVDPTAPKSSAPKVVFHWIQKQLGIRFTRLPPRAERQEKMVKTLIGSIEKAQEKMDLLWVDLSQELRDDWKKEVLSKFAAEQGGIPSVKGGIQDWARKVESAYSSAFSGLGTLLEEPNNWIAAYSLLPANKKTMLLQGLEDQYGGVNSAYKNNEFLTFSKYLNDIPTSWLAAYSKLSDGARASLRTYLDSEVSSRHINRDSLQAQVRELSRVWAAPPLGMPDDYVYVESIKVDFFEWIEHSKDWLKFLQGKADTYQIFSRTHYPNYDPQYHDPIFYVRGRNFEVLRRNGGNIYLMPGTYDNYSGYSQVTDAERFAYNGSRRYSAHPIRWFSAGIFLAVGGFFSQLPVLAAVGALVLILTVVNNWRGGWPAVTHPAPLYNIAYYAQMVADRTRTTRDYMAGTVYPINEYRRALLPYRGIFEQYFINQNLFLLSDEEFFPKVWGLTNGSNLGPLQVYPTLQAFLDDSLGQSARETVRQYQAGTIDPAQMSYEEAVQEEETDRNNMVNPAIAAHKGLQGPGPTNSSQGNTLRQNQITLGLIAIAFIVLVPVGLSLRLDLIAAIAEGTRAVSTGLFSGVPVLGDAFLSFTNTLSQFVSLEEVEYLTFSATGISLFGGITFGMSAFALLMVGMAFKIILFFQGFKSKNRMVDLGFGAGLLGVAGALWFLAPLSWFALVGTLLFGFIGTGWILKTAFATRYKEELTEEHIERFVPEHLLKEALRTVSNPELASLGVTPEKFEDWLVQHGAKETWRRLAAREDSFLFQARSALKGIPNTKRPIHRLRQDDRFNLLKIVYLANVQGPRRRELIVHLLKLYEDPRHIMALEQRMGTAQATKWLDQLSTEVNKIDTSIAGLGENPSPEKVLDVYFKLGQERIGQFSNEDILRNISFLDINELKENKTDHESLWPKIILMQTAFGATSEERLFALLESADKLWPSIQVDITLDDNDEEGRNGILKSMKDPTRLGKYADRIVISNHAAHGTNFGIGNIHQRHKPMMNSEAVFRLNYRFKKYLGRLPFFQTLVDMEDVFLKEVIDDKMAIWAMRERTLNEQLARRESEENTAGFTAHQRWLAVSRTASLAMVVGGMAAVLLGFGSAFAAPTVILAGISSGSWLGVSGLAIALAGWVYRRQTAKRPTADSQQWGIRMDSEALESEYKKTLQGIATAAGLGRNWARNDFNNAFLFVNEEVNRRNLAEDFNVLHNAFLLERGLRSMGDVRGAERARVSAVLLAENLSAQDRSLYELWAYAQVFPTFKDFRRQVFRIRNMPDVIQTELRQIPINAADRRFSEQSHIDYLFWHNTIQIGEDASGFMFLGGTGNTFMWELLGGTDDHAYVRLNRMLWPVREANRKEETERPFFLRVLFLIPLPLGVLSILVPPSFRGQFDQARATWVSSQTLYKFLNRYVPTGVWDKFNIIEDSERGRRSAFLGLTSHRLVGRDKEVLEDALPRLGPKWLNQRQRWIIQQTFFAIVRFLPVGLMFFGQYLGAGLGFSLVGDRAHVVQGLLGMGSGFIFGGIGAYLVGLVIFRWLGRAGLIRNTQFYVNPIAGLSPDRGPGLWRGLVSRAKAYYKFQQISHLAASVPMMMASSVLVTITLLYFLGFFFNVGPVLEYVDGLGSPGLTGFVGMMVIFIQTFFPLIEAVVPSTFWGILIFLYPPVAMNLMSLVTVLYTSWRDDESIRAAIQTKMTSRVHSFLFLFVSTGMKDAAPFDLAGEESITREREEILTVLREVEKNSAGQFVPKTRGLNRRILEGFLLNSNLTQVNAIIAELQSIARELTAQPDNALDPEKLGDFTKRTRDVIEGQVKPLLREMNISEENQNQIMDKLLEDQTELEDMALGQLRYGWGTFSAGILSWFVAGVLIWFGWDYPLWLGAFLLALGSALMTISSLNLVGNIPALKASVQMRHFAVQAGRSLRMYFYFTFLHPSAWRNFGVAVNSFYKPGANEPFWTRGRDEGLGDLSLWELTPRRRFQIWWAGTGNTILQYSVFPFIILASLPWLVAVHDWRMKIEREIGVEQVKAQIVIKEEIPTPKNWISWDRSVAAAYRLNPDAFQGWVMAQIEEAGQMYQDYKDRDSVMEKRSMRMLDTSLIAVRVYADGLIENTNWDNPIDAQKAIRRYEEVVQSVQKTLAGMRQMDRFEKLFPGLSLKSVPILNQFSSNQGKLNPRDVLIQVKSSTADRSTPRSVPVELRIPQTDLTGQVVAVASQMWPTEEATKVELRLDQVSYPKDGNLKSPENERKAEGASAQRLPTGRDVVQTFVFHSYFPGVLAPNYTSGKVNKLEIVAYTRGSGPFEAKMRFNEILVRSLADPRVNVPVLSVQRSPVGPNTISWFWTSWNRFMGRDVSREAMVTGQAPWESYWLVELAGLAVPLLIFFQWSPVFAAGLGIIWGLLHMGGTFDKDLKPISGMKALVPSLGKAAVAAVAVGLYAVGLDFLIALSPLSEYLSRMALFEGLGSLSQISLLSNFLTALPFSLLLAGPLFKFAHKNLNKGAVASAWTRRSSQTPISISVLAERIKTLDTTTTNSNAMGEYLKTVLGERPLVSLDVSSTMDPLVLRTRLVQEVPQAFRTIDSAMGGKIGVEVEPSLYLGQMMAPGVRGEEFSSAVRNYAFALGYQMARSDKPVSLVPLLEVAYLTVASRSAEVGVHMNPAGFASAFQLGSTFARETVRVRENEAAEFHMGPAELAGKGSEVLEHFVAAVAANARALAANRDPAPIELVSSDANVTSPEVLFGAVQAYVQKNYPWAIPDLMRQIKEKSITARLSPNLPMKNGLIDSTALFNQIKATRSQVTGLACFTSQPQSWADSDFARIIPVGKVLGEVLDRLNAMRATDDNA